MSANNILSTPGERAVLRRVALFWAVYLLILIAFGFLKGFLPVLPRQLFWGSTSALALVFLSRQFIRTEGNPRFKFDLLPDRLTTIRILAGGVIGSLLPLAILGVTALVSGGVSFAMVPLIPKAFAWNLATVVALAAMEELGFRGYPLRALYASFGLWPAVWISAGAFALCHVAFGWSWSAVVVGVLPAGLVFGMSAIASGGLAMPIALHAAVNLMNWLVSSQDKPGLVRLVVNEEHKTSVGQVSTIASVVIEALLVAALWMYFRKSAPSGKMEEQSDSALDVSESSAERRNFS